MAAGDVTIHGASSRVFRGKRVVWGELQLDGANPSPINLAAYMSAVKGGVVSLKASATPGDDPTSFSVNPSGTTLNVYAYKTDGTDPTLVASANNTAVVDFIAWGDA